LRLKVCHPFSRYLWLINPPANIDDSNTPYMERMGEFLERIVYVILRMTKFPKVEEILEKLRTRKTMNPSTAIPLTPPMIASKMTLPGLHLRISLAPWISAEKGPLTEEPNDELQPGDPTIKRRRRAPSGTKRKPHF
jgi:hypothetical protein